VLLFVRVDDEPPVLCCCALIRSDGLVVVGAIFQVSKRVPIRDTFRFPALTSNDDTSTTPSTSTSPRSTFGFNPRNWLRSRLSTRSIHLTPFIQLPHSLPWPQLRVSLSLSLATRVSNCSRVRRTGRMVITLSSRSFLHRSKFVFNSHLIQLRFAHEANSYTLNGQAPARTRDLRRCRL
jgi:hypothetical protein